ncbi:molybdopterin synthase sulfur carrier subunit [Oceanobacillus limi]|uniref:Molybdopterin synthase sulfur carrier subunit n=1 Tax=Oceanobacillus limi TaxID=930131 RepID=A0A1I0G8D2_9BACI|nr:molybdopterin converting factor subunit 1 [Oceanobacillus limi]SET67242.1 molybdopterin synthase sulfur carrier subunit [Oceanobacillus limi]
MIRILLFAHLQDELGTESIEMDGEMTIKELKNNLLLDYPSLRLDSVMVAVNEEYALDDDIVKSGDTIALIPPVSGG